MSLNQKKNKQLKYTFLRFVLVIILIITIICVFVPFSPTMPSVALDASWGLAMNQAYSQNLIFGNDIIFTFGPYASIYSRYYHPSTDIMAVFGNLLISLCYILALLLITRKSSLKILLALIVSFAFFIFSKDSLLFSYGLVSALSFFKIVKYRDENSINERVVVISILLLALPFGLLPLVKGSLLIVCVGITILCVVLLLLKNKYLYCFIFIPTVVLSNIVFWLLASQSLSQLPQYYISMVPLITGYTEALSQLGFLHEIVFALIVTLLSIYGLFKSEYKWIDRVFLILIFTFIYFLSFKAGFVRHEGHVLILAGVLLLSLLFQIIILDSREYTTIAFANALLVILFVGLTMVTYRIDRDAIKQAIESDQSYSKHEFNLLSRYDQAAKLISFIGPVKLSNIMINSLSFPSPYRSAYEGIKKRLAPGDTLQQDFQDSLFQIQRESELPRLKGTSDIYSFSQTKLLASKNIWVPRPIFQSYSVYTKKLAEINKKHLISDGAADNIFFRIEPTDSHLPSIEDGASWPVLLNKYKPMSFSSDYLVLSKDKTQTENNELSLISNQKSHVKFNQPVIIDQSNSLLFAKLNLQHTFLGKLASILFKTSEIQINIQMEDGEKKVFRIVPNMASSEFLISPLVESTEEFSSLFSAPEDLITKKVKSFSIECRGMSWHWSNNITVEFFERTYPKTNV